MAAFVLHARISTKATKLLQHFCGISHNSEYMGGLYHYSFKMGRRPKNPRRDPLGAWLHYLRKQAGLSQEEAQAKLSARLGEEISTSAFSIWERKGNLGGRDIIPALAETLGVTIEQLLRVRRTKDGKYIPVVPTAEEEQRLHIIGERKKWDWTPPETMPKGIEAQGSYKKHHFDGADGKPLPEKPVKRKKPKTGDKPQDEQGTNPTS
ncbi:MAG TPA: helix-turn-helix transcriptional regulator [Verrucomicrobiae bacterium]